MSGGAGSMASAILSLKKNRALLKKRKIKDLKGLLKDTSGKTEVEFKKVTPQELFRIKKNIRKQHKRNVRIEIGIYIASVALTTVFFFLLYRFMSS